MRLDGIDLVIPFRMSFETEAFNMRGVETKRGINGGLGSDIKLQKLAVLECKSLFITSSYIITAPAITLYPNHQHHNRYHEVDLRSLCPRGPGFGHSH